MNSYGVTFIGCNFYNQTGINEMSSEASPQLIGGVTVEQSLATLESVLGMISAATPTKVDDHVLAYVRALRKSPELVALLSADLDKPAAQSISVGTIIAILGVLKQIRDFLNSRRNAAQSASAAMDPQAFDLATLMELVKLVKQFIDLIAKFKGDGGSGSQSSYVPNDQGRC